MPSIVVVLCSHNGERYIAAQIASILDQGAAFVDSIHVHDFASADRTREIVADFEADTGGRVSLTAHADAPGPAASFIEALRLTLPVLSPDALILFADQDDVWLPTKITTVLEAVGERGLSASEPFLLFHDVKVVDAGLTLQRPTYYTGNPFRVPRDLHPVRLMMANPAIGHTMMITPPIARAILDWPDTDRYLMHDWLAILIASRIGRIEHVALPLSLYRQHDANVLGAYRRKRSVPPLTRLMRFMDRMIGQAMAFSQALATNGALSTPAAARVESACRGGYRQAAAALAVAAIVHGPTSQRKAIGLLLLARAVAGPMSAPSSKEAK